jgi:hypothetical protein
MRKIAGLIFIVLCMLPLQAAAQSCPTAAAPCYFATSQSQATKNEPESTQ